MLLAGVSVIDATDRLGWLAGRLLADLGADVIRIEARGSDRSRSEWRAFNVNKRVLEYDGTPADRTRAQTLLAAADICLLTPSSGCCALFDPDSLRRSYPRLVVVSITPYGSAGPRSHWKGSDIEIMAAGGAMALAGEPGGTPVRVGEPQSYGWAGAQAAAGALIALYRRDATGEGDLVEVSAQASVVTALSHAPAFVDLDGPEPTRAGAFITGRSIKGARYRVFWPCRDGYINFIFYGGAAGRRTNEQLLAWMRERGAGLGALAGIDWKTWDPTLADQAEVDAIEAPVLKFFAGISKREFLDEGHRREMLGYPVSTVADIAADPQLAAREFFQDVAGASERFCGSFAVVDGVRPPLRHAPGEVLLNPSPACGGGQPREARRVGGAPYAQSLVHGTPPGRLRRPPSPQAGRDKA
jgi:benzylsuccinate CoA-transferase BbsE subunit